MVLKPQQVSQNMAQCQALVSPGPFAVSHFGLPLCQSSSSRAGQQNTALSQSTPIYTVPSVSDSAAEGN